MDKQTVEVLREKWRNIVRPPGSSFTMYCRMERKRPQEASVAWNQLRPEKQQVFAEIRAKEVAVYKRKVDEFNESLTPRQSLLFEEFVKNTKEKDSPLARKEKTKRRVAGKVAPAGSKEILCVDLTNSDEEEEEEEASEDDDDEYAPDRCLRFPMN